MPAFLPLAVALLLPWIMGSALVALLLRGVGNRNPWIVAGQGYLVGIFLTTLLIRFWDLVGLVPHFWSLAAPLAVITIGALVALRVMGSNAQERIQNAPLTAWHWLFVAVILGLIVVRYAALTEELLLRPLYAWDAWMNWAPKAIVWLHYQDLVPFVSKSDWLWPAQDTLVYTAGASEAWRYPNAVPLIQFWMMLALGQSDNTLIYLPWLFVAIALGMTLYGHVRQYGRSVAASLAASYVLLSLPLLGVHVALPGYADLWLTATFGCAVLALHEWSRDRRWPYALLTLFLALMCLQLKIPGLIMGGIVLLVFLFAVSGISYRGGALLLAAAAAFAVGIALVGVDVSIPGVGRLAIDTSGIQLPYIGLYDVEFHPVQESMVRTLFVMINWNILWYAFLFFLGLGVIQGAFRAPPSITLSALMLGMAFIGFVYFFTNRYQFALDFTQVNRALIYLTPLLVFYVFTTGIARLAAYDSARAESLSHGYQ